MTRRRGRPRRDPEDDGLPEPVVPVALEDVFREVADAVEERRSQDEEE